MNRTIIIGSRGSDLALWQAYFVQSELKRHGAESTIKIIKTQGDRIQNIGFDKMEGKGFFTKEIESALLGEAIDLAVHSHKDLETDPPAGLKIAAVSHRADPADLLLIRKEKVDTTQKWNLVKNAIVGTSSARRKALMLAFREDVQLQDLRGNVPTRINKLREGQYDAILLAAAGVKRLELDLSDLEVVSLDPREFVPAPAQGVLALQIRETDNELADFMQKMTDTQVATTIAVERKILNLFEGGCQLPLGAYCIEEAGQYKLWATAAESWDSFPARTYLEATTTEGLAELAVAALKKKDPKHVFISRDLTPDSHFKRFLEKQGHTVTGKSLIQIQAVPFNTPTKADWFFFSSKNAVQNFLAQGPRTRGIKIAAIGPGTAESLKTWDLTPDFVGAGNDTATIGKQFAQIAAGQRVLFPQSDRSLRTVQEQCSEAVEVVDLVVYKTIAAPEVAIPEADIFVFTSPTNVASFFSRNLHGLPAQYLAIGTATRQKLAEFGHEAVPTPWAPQELALADLV